MFKLKIVAANLLQIIWREKKQETFDVPMMLVYILIFTLLDYQES